MSGIIRESLYVCTIRVSPEGVGTVSRPGSARSFRNNKIWPAELTETMDEARQNFELKNSTRALYHAEDDEFAEMKEKFSLKNPVTTLYPGRPSETNC